MLNLCFAVLWIFLSKVVENNFIDLSKDAIEANLAREFLQIFEESDWAVIGQERETALLIVAMLTNFFMKYAIMKD